MKNREFTIMFGLFCIMTLVQGFTMFKLNELKKNSSDAICQKYFNTDSAVVSIEKARAAYHKQDRPNTIIVRCWSK